MVHEGLMGKAGLEPAPQKSRWHWERQGKTLQERGGSGNGINHKDQMEAQK